MRIDESLPLEEAYFRWLIDKATDGEHTHLSDYVFRVLHKTPFEVHVSNDENRADEGVSLRWMFLEETPYFQVRWSDEWAALECSIFEMLVALSIRAGYQTDDNASWWFSIFTKNLGLGHSPSKARRILDRLNRREFDYDGYGGLFPLRDPKTDQRETEIWYQLAAYILENGLY